VIPHEKFVLAGAMLMTLAGTAYANECPNLIKQDEDIAKMMPSDDATMVKVND
jgi:hypothetical protein